MQHLEIHKDAAPARDVIISCREHGVDYLESSPKNPSESSININNQPVLYPRACQQTPTQRSSKAHKTLRLAFGGLSPLSSSSSISRMIAFPPKLSGRGAVSTSQKLYQQSQCSSFSRSHRQSKPTRGDHKRQQAVSQRARPQGHASVALRAVQLWVY